MSNSYKYKYNFVVLMKDNSSDYILLKNPGYTIISF